jgi:hypothetical protein
MVLGELEENDPQVRTDGPFFIYLPQNGVFI